MKNFTKLFLFTVCSFAVAFSFYKFKVSHHKSGIVASAQIIESNSIQDVKKFIEPETLFIFDYDQVLVQGKEDYGFDAWFCAMFAELEKKGLSDSVVIEKLLPVYEQIQQTAEVKAVEDCAKKLIEDLKNSGHDVMILSIRSLCLIDSIFRQLKSVGMDIQRNAIPEKGINVALAKLKAKYIDGFLFCDGYYPKKGEALKVFLQGKPELKVKNIVFVDDKLKNLESVKTAAQELGINFVGIRYGRTDQHVKAYKLDEKSLALAADLAKQEPTALQPAVA